MSEAFFVAWSGGVTDRECTRRYLVSGIPESEAFEEVGGDYSRRKEGLELRCVWSAEMSRLVIKGYRLQKTETKQGFLRITEYITP